MKKLILAIYFCIIPGLGFASDAAPLTGFLFYKNPMVLEGDKEMVTDKITFNSTSISEKNKIQFTGTYHPNQTVEGSYLLCQEFNNSDLYNCVAKKDDNQFVTFDLNIIKNSAKHSYEISGYFGTGLTFDKSLVVSDSKAHSVTGYLAGIAAVYSKKGTENEANGELDILNLKYLESRYRVILEDNQGDLKFKIKEFMPFVALEGLEDFYLEAIYNDRELKLDIPVVEYNGSKYHVVLLNTPDEQGNFEFTWQEATLLPE